MAKANLRHLAFPIHKGTRIEAIMSASMLPTEDSRRTTEAALTKQFSEQHLTDSLIRALRPHWQGLERRLVFQAMRTRYQAIGRRVPFEFEETVDRIFERSVAGFNSQHPRSGPALFHRRHEPLGEIWTLNAKRANAWLDAR